jgi:short-subunit dehydrogenase
MAVYYATKAYVLSFTEALHHELKGTGIRVSALCPGPTHSEFSDVADSHSPTLERMKMPAAPVVALGLAGLDRNRAVVIPGFKNKVGAWMSRLLPRSTMRNIIGRIKV